MKKIYSLKEHEAFEKAAEGIMFEALDNEKEVPIYISVGDVTVELPMCADYWEEMCLALKECYEVECEELPQTTGNTKITSKGLIHNYLRKECEDHSDEDLMEVYRRFVRMCNYPSVLSDVAECIRIENDLRGSEVKCLYDDFEGNKLDSVVEEEIKSYLMGKFEVDYSEGGDKSFLMFYGRYNTGEVINFVWGKDYDFSDWKRETVDNLWEEIENCN